MTTRRWIVRGEVQGVGFRWFVKRAADGLGLGGFARNLRDGTVEVISQGADTALQELEHHLRRGPAHARVASVEEVHVSPELEVPRSFETR